MSCGYWGGTCLFPAVCERFRSGQAERLAGEAWQRARRTPMSVPDVRRCCRRAVVIIVTCRVGRCGASARPAGRAWTGRRRRSRESFLRGPDVLPTIQPARRRGLPTDGAESVSGRRRRPALARPRWGGARAARQAALIHERANQQWNTYTPAWASWTSCKMLVARCGPEPMVAVDRML